MDFKLWFHVNYKNIILRINILTFFLTLYIYRITVNENDFLGFLIGAIYTLFTYLSEVCRDRISDNIDELFHVRHRQYENIRIISHIAASNTSFELSYDKYASYIINMDVMINKGNWNYNSEYIFNMNNYEELLDSINKLVREFEEVKNNFKEEYPIKLDACSLNENDYMLINNNKKYLLTNEQYLFLDYMDRNFFIKNKEDISNVDFQLDCFLRKEHKKLNRLNSKIKQIEKIYSKEISEEEKKQIVFNKYIIPIYNEIMKLKTEYSNSEMLDEIQHIIKKQDEYMDIIKDFQRYTIEKIEDIPYELEMNSILNVLTDNYGMEEGYEVYERLYGDSINKRL